MNNKITFTVKALEEYMSLQNEDKKILKKVNQLINDIIRNGNDGIGHPEPLKENLSGYWSRRIDSKNRLIYCVSDDGHIKIIQCKTHYNDK